MLSPNKAGSWASRWTGPSLGQGSLGQTQLSYVMALMVASGEREDPVASGQGGLSVCVCSIVCFSEPCVY